jgi:hypothetical protein
MIDTMRLPKGINLMALSGEHVLQDLTMVCRRLVIFRRRTKSGVWLIVERQSGGDPHQMVLQIVNRMRCLAVAHVNRNCTPSILSQTCYGSRQKFKPFILGMNDFG